MTTYTYQDWLSSYGKPSGEPYDEAEARRRFDAGKRVTAVIGDRAAPEVVIKSELKGELVVVTWLDALQRPELEYIWARKRHHEGWPADKLLLEQVRITEYDTRERLPEVEGSHHENYYLKPDGTFTAYRSHRDGPLERMDGFEPEERQIEDVPEFGAWEPLMRRER